MSNKQINIINEFIVSFLEKIGADTNLWNSDENMKNFMSLFKKTKDKKTKDKDKPKRARSAYIFFCKEKRPEVKISLGKEANSAKVTTELGKMWRELKEHKDYLKLLAPYQELADEDKKRYDQEMESYVPSTEEEIKNKKSVRKSKQIKVKDKPKRARSAYIFFCTDNRSKAISNLEDKSITTTSKAVTSELGRMWREFKNCCSDSEMAKYKCLADEDKKRLSDQSDTSLSSSRDAVNSSPKSLSDKAIAYRMYIKSTRNSVKKNFPELSAKEISSIILERWKNFSDQEKHNWLK
jgi:hypothetical protein